MLKKNIIIVFLILLVLGLACAKDKLIIFHAGSLSIPFKQMEQAFEKKYSEIDVLREASGSRTAARKVSDLNKPCDIVASADYSVIEQLLIPEYADWNISFATNEMAIMFSEHSKYSDKINSKNWYEILLSEDVGYGRADPNSDPCGYRTLLVWQLAEKYYNKKKLYKKLIDGCPKKNIRPKETDLIALLEAGEIDYLFIYKSVAMQHNSPHIDLPVDISMKDNTYNDFYSQTSVEITGKKPGEFITKKGQAMVYGITIPKNAPNYEMAVKFIEFIFSEQGQSIIKVNGQGLIFPGKTNQSDSVPEELREYIQ